MRTFVVAPNMHGLADLTWDGHQTCGLVWSDYPSGTYVARAQVGGGPVRSPILLGAREGLGAIASDGQELAVLFGVQVPDYMWDLSLARVDATSGALTGPAPFYTCPPHQSMHPMLVWNGQTYGAVYNTNATGLNSAAEVHFATFR